MAVSSMVWWPSISTSPLVAHGQVEAGVAAQRRQHVVVERHTGVDVNLPGAVEVELDDDVGFLGAALNSRAACCCPYFGHGAPTGVAGASSVAAIWALASQERVVLVGQARRGAQVAGNADVADQHAGVQVALPGGRRVGEFAEQHEVRVARDHPKTHAGQGR